MSFRLTYSTMFDPPAALHERFEAAVGAVRGRFGRRYGHFIDGADAAGGNLVADVSPINTDWVLGEFPVATAANVEEAVAAASRAFPTWRAMPMAERNAILRAAATLMENRVYDIAAALAIEVGKNRMESLGEAQETAEFFQIYCDIFEKERGFEEDLPDDPVPDCAMHNRSVMKPYGVWAVIAPYNFPIALAGGPAAAALVTGNTVVVKASPDTPWSVRLLVDCLHDAGIPHGVVNLLADPDDSAGPRLVDQPDVAGITFTGSHEAGMEICRRSVAGAFPRPCITEMGGNNPAIVSANANLDDAAIGIVRSAFGLSGQKCSALSRLYVEDPVADELMDRLKSLVDGIETGDPLLAGSYMGPVGNASAYAGFSQYVRELDAGGARFVTGGRILRDRAMAKGYYCAPTIAETPLEHRLWQHEMFAPIVLVARVPELQTAMALSNNTGLGLTAGFYGNAEETRWFSDNIEAGVIYTNRPQGATTGAWPGYQRFGGWKGSGNTGKGFASKYYLSGYLREQSQTSVE
jgi:1-pyrroline-5-carboxylate dehydrogenase